MSDDTEEIPSVVVPADPMAGIHPSHDLQPPAYRLFGTTYCMACTKVVHGTEIGVSAFGSRPCPAVPGEGRHQAT